MQDTMVVECYVCERQLGAIPAPAGSNARGLRLECARCKHAREGKEPVRRRMVRGSARGRRRSA